MLSCRSSLSMCFTRINSLNFFKMHHGRDGFGKFSNGASLRPIQTVSEHIMSRRISYTPICFRNLSKRKNSTSSTVDRLIPVLTASMPIDKPNLISSESNRLKLIVPQPYDYFVIVDLESTCDDGFPGRVTQANQEIIEFPWVVMDAATGEIVDQRQHYARPVMEPILTSFCTNLTGIQQSQVDSGSSLAEIVAEFDEYCAHRFTAQNKTYCLVTDGDWDFKCMLQNEARRKQIPLHEHFRRFLNIKKLFVRHLGLGIESRNSLAHMVNVLRLTFSGSRVCHVFCGRHHSGIDDCHTIGGIVRDLLFKSVRFDLLSEFDTHYDPLTSGDFQDFNALRSVAPVGFDPVLTVRLQHLPLRITGAAILAFCSPLRPRLLHIVTAVGLQQTNSAVTISIDDSVTSNDALLRTPAIAGPGIAFLELGDRATVEKLCLLKNGFYMPKHRKPINVQSHSLLDHAQH